MTNRRTRRDVLVGLTTLTAIRPAWPKPGAAQPPEEQQKRNFVRVGEAVEVREYTQPMDVRWSGERLFGAEVNRSSEPLLFVYQESQPVERIRFRIPDAGHINIHDMAMGKVGQIALSGSAYFDDGKAASFLAILSPARDKQVVVRTWPTVAGQLAWGPDGTLWSAGYTFDELGDYVVGKNEFRRFDERAKLLSTTIVPSRSGHTAGGTYDCLLRANGQRVFWMSNDQEFVEFDRSGKEVLRTVGPPLTDKHLSYARTMAVSDSDVVMYAALMQPGTAVWAFERSSRTWMPTELVGLTERKHVQILGFNGDDLIVSPKSEIVERYRLSQKQ